MIQRDTSLIEVKKPSAQSVSPKPESIAEVEIEKSNDDYSEDNFEKS